VERIIWLEFALRLVWVERTVRNQRTVWHFGSIRNIGSIWMERLERTIWMVLSLRLERMVRPKRHFWSIWDEWAERD